MTEEANVVNDPTDDQAPLLSYPPSSSKSIIVNDGTDQKERKGTRFVIYMEQTMCLPCNNKVTQRYTLVSTI